MFNGVFQMFRVAVRVGILTLLSEFRTGCKRLKPTGQCVAGGGVWSVFSTKISIDLDLAVVLCWRRIIIHGLPGLVECMLDWNFDDDFGMNMLCYSKTVG